MSICVDQEAWSHFNHSYYTVLENVTWEAVKNSGDIPQRLHDANCSAAIMYQKAIDRMHAGEFAGAGRPVDYDCRIRKVPSEEVLLTFAVGFPVAPSLVHGLSWALTSVLEEGLAAKAEIQHRTSLIGSFVSKCSVQEESQKRLDWPDVAGALIDAFVIILFGALVFGIAALVQGNCCKGADATSKGSLAHPPPGPPPLPSPLGPPQPSPQPSPQPQATLPVPQAQSMPLQACQSQPSTTSPRRRFQPAAQTSSSSSSSSPSKLEAGQASAFSSRVS